MEFKLETYELQPSTGQLIKRDQIRQFKGLRVAQVKNNAGIMSYTISGFSKKATGQNLKRYTTVIALKYNKAIIFVGYIQNVIINHVGDNFDIRVEVQGQFGRLYKRFTRDIDKYNSLDAGEIAWQLIEYTQSLPSGHLGIVKGEVQYTRNRDRTFENKVIGDAIVDLTEVIGGFDFRLEPVVENNNDLNSLSFNVYESFGAIKLSIPTLNLGGNVTAYEAMTREDVENVVVYKGAGTGDDFVTYVAENTQSQESYSRNEAFILRDDISVLATLEEHANRRVDKYKDNIWTIDVAIKPDSNLVFRSFDIGDTIPINISTFQGLAECIGIEFLVDENGVIEWLARLEYIS